MKYILGVMNEIATLKEADSIIGRMSEPSKMPCWGYSLPALECKIGSKLRKVKNSVCSKCYALKNRYSFNCIKAAMYRRLDALSHPRWVEAMAYAVNRRCGNGYFRWHDSGDIQSVEHFEKIVRVCELTPSVKHWIPTREFKIVFDFIKQRGKIPSNLCIRFSHYMIDSQFGKSMIAVLKRHGITAGYVSTGDFDCPASKRGNNCGDCRRCWNRACFAVTYHEH